MHHYEPPRPARRLVGARMLCLLFCAAWLGAACTASTEAQLGSARALQDVGDFSSSIEPLRQILASDPDHQEANYRLGLALVQTKQLPLAIWPLRKAADSEDFAMQGGLLLASTLLQTEGYEDAIIATGKLLEGNPDNLGALLVRMQAHMGVGLNEEALQDIDRILEIDPGHYRALASRASVLGKLERFDQAEDAWKDLERLAVASGDPSLSARGCVALSTYYFNRKSDKAEATVRKCTDDHPASILALGSASVFFDVAERPDEATALWRRGIETEPDSLELRSGLANRLAKQGDDEGAEAILRESAELFDDAQTWNQLAMFYQERDKHAQALEATEQALARASSQPEELMFRKADLLIATGKLDEAEKIAAGLEQSVYQDLIQGRLLMERGEEEAALDAFEAGLSRWPNNAAARFLAGHIAEKLGQREKALSHYREATRTDAKATDGALAAAALQFSDGYFEDAAVLANRHADNRPFMGPDAHLIAARSAAVIGTIEEMRKTLADLALAPRYKSLALAERAALEIKMGNPEIALRAIEQAELDLSQAENDGVLRFLAEALVALNRPEEALERVEAAHTGAGDTATAAHHDLRGRIYYSAGEPKQARAEFEQALARDAEFAPALAGVARVAADLGELDLALEHARHAATVDPKDYDTAYLVAQILLSQGHTDAGLAQLREVLESSPGHGAAANDLAWHLASRGEELPFALKLAQRAVRLDSRAETLDTLGWVQLKNGNLAASVESFEKALALRPDAASTRYRLGVALDSLGRADEALSAFREALGSGPFPEADAAKAEVARLEPVAGATP